MVILVQISSSLFGFLTQKKVNQESKINLTKRTGIIPSSVAFSPALAMAL